MPKRLTDTEKWKDAWFVDLTVPAKTLFCFLCDNCDIAGFYERSDRIMLFFLGMDAEQLEMATIDLKKSVVFDGGVYFLKNFIYHQRNYPLNPLNNCHKAIITQLIRRKDTFGKYYNNELWGFNGAYQGLSSPICNSKGKGKGKTIKDNKYNNKYNTPTVEQVIEYCHERKTGVDPYKWHDFYTSKGWMIGKNHMKDWKAAVRTWENKTNAAGWHEESGKL